MDDNCTAITVSKTATCMEDKHVLYITVQKRQGRLLYGEYRIDSVGDTVRVSHEPIKSMYCRSTYSLEKDGERSEITVRLESTMEILHECNFYSITKYLILYTLDNDE